MLVLHREETIFFSSLGHPFFSRLLSNAFSDFGSVGRKSRAYGTQARSVRGSQNRLCYPDNPFPLHWKRCMRCVKDVAVDLPCRKDAIKVPFREVNTNKYIINTVLTTSYTLFENTRLNLP